MSDQVAEVSAEYLAAAEKNSVPVGYKQTEAGIIPENWEVKKLREISPSQSVGLVINPSSYYSNLGNIPMLVGSHVYESKINWASANRITTESNARLPASRLNCGDLVTVRVGDPGVTAVVPPELDQANCASMMIIRKADKFDSQWLCFLMNSSLGKARIEGVQYGTAQKQFNIIDAVDFLFPFPPKKEQTAIANALSDVDALISELEKLIAKKQAIKTATMQQLLTGRTRLPQFALREDGSLKGYKPSELGEIPEDWGVLRFDQNFSIYAGGDAPKDSLSKIKTDKCPYPIFANAIQEKGLYGYTGYKRSKPDSVTITARGYLGHAEYRDEPFFPIVRLLVMEPTGTLDSKYTTYAINERIEFPIESTGVPQLTAPQVGKFATAAPNDKKEQTSIANILSDMDSDIQTLEQRLSKIRQIKQGMMQELLTGKTRLVKPIEEEREYG